MRTATVNFDGRILSMQGPEQVERLGIKSEYPWTDFSESIFAELGTMHIIAPYLPLNIRTDDLYISPEIKELIGKMYESRANEKGGRKRKPPHFISPTIGHGYTLKINSSSPRKEKVVILYSAGKDSMWNLMWAIEEYGVDNVLVLHIRGLNKNSGPSEYKNVLNQKNKFGFKNLEVIELLNGSLNTGFRIMRSREMFIAGLAIPVALEFGASKIIREGYFDCTDPDAYFTGVEDNMVYFNRILNRLGIPVQVYWRNRDEMITIKDIFDRKPQWMPHVCNCFTIACYRGSHRERFQKAMPTFPLYDSQCGVCVKCKITNVARILYDPTMVKTHPTDIRTYLEKTDKWIRDQKRANEGTMSNVLDMIEGPFMRDYAKACRQFGVKARSLGKA